MTADVQLFWNGERIRGIHDQTEGVWITEHSGEERTVELYPNATGQYFLYLRNIDDCQADCIVSYLAT